MLHDVLNFTGQLELAVSIDVSVVDDSAIIEGHIEVTIEPRLRRPHEVFRQLSNDLRPVLVRSIHWRRFLEWLTYDNDICVLDITGEGRHERPKVVLVDVGQELDALTAAHLLNAS